MIRVARTDPRFSSLYRATVARGWDKLRAYYALDPLALLWQKCGMRW
ncbi:hypothetical protein Q4610_14215 [Sphingobium sp. HBC34]|uniref:Uncharacterized protein n=1 Tax=Sphingobium cyanobacteriorum TaxID=3063954 RepID=A0ABT8ZRX7_9SPHN|nr:hypothetical protein [Sphingobium sp. HBC34]MDO7836201.1 hypothetical protein [Sphingobium sp. HBC34]